MYLPDKVAIVSGVGPGLGRSTALGLARAGANVVLGARTTGFLEEVAGEVRGLGREALVVAADITNKADATKIAAATVEHFGRIDVLVNNAGWMGGALDALEWDLDEWQAVVDGNLVGTMAMCKAAAEHMVKAKSGSIVNVTTVQIRQGRAKRTAYASSKAGVEVLSQSLASELGPHGIRVNSVAPGHIWSDKLQAFYESQAKVQGKTYDDVYGEFVEQMALRKIPTPDEIANAIVFMASDWASAITGQSLDVNAGFFYH